MTELLAERIASVHDRIAAAARSAGRLPAEITLVAVTKTQSAQTVREAAAFGLEDFGENYGQEASVKQNELQDLIQIQWHFIGHLQTNKASSMTGRYALIHGVDNLRLARRLAASASQAGALQDVLVQVHLGDEETKSGAAPEQVSALCEEIDQLGGIRLCGLMGIAPLLDSDGVEDDPRRYFAQLRGLYEMLPSANRRVLSMGMSGDFEAAIEEGATLVRIGSAIFGPRPASESDEKRA